MLLLDKLRTPRKKQLLLYKKISTISTLFAGVREENFKDIINKSLKILGDFVGADRTYIFRYDFNKKTTSNIFEYCANGISKEIDNLQNVPINDIDSWINEHKQGKTLYYSNVNKLSPNDQVRKILEPQSIKSIMTVPLIYRDELYGFLGFDSVKTYRRYTHFERQALIEFSNLLVNVLKRVEFENALKYEQLRLDYVLKAANIGAWEWNIETNETKFTEKWSEMIGYSLEELKPLNLDTWKKLTHNEDLPNAMQNIQETLDNKRQHYESKIRMKHKNGNDVWVKDVGSVIERKEGKPYLMMGVHININDIIQQQNHLSMIKQALDYSHSMVVITDAKGHIQYINSRFTDITGYSKDDIIGKTPRVMKSGYHDDEYYKKLWETITKKREWVGEFYNKKKNNECYWEEANISPVLDVDNNITHFIAVKKDITKEKEIATKMEEKSLALKEKLAASINDIEDAQKASIIALAKLTESRDYDTGKHIERVQYLSKNLAKNLRNHPKYSKIIDQQFIDDIFYASALHDIGKISIPDDVLLKNDKLTKDEFKTIRSHSVFGAKILLEMSRYYPNSSMVIMGSKIAKYHHEKWDGSGYPEGLKYGNIPLEARIMAVVDVYDALRSNRPYKSAFTHNQTKAIIIEGSGHHFDPDIVHVFNDIHKQFESTYDSLV